MDLWNYAGMSDLIIGGFDLMMSVTGIGFVSVKMLSVNFKGAMTIEIVPTS